MRTALVILMAACGSLTAAAQSVRSLVNGGNDLYDERKYEEAAEQYRKALDRQSSLVPGHFNLGNALYRQGKFDEAEKSYEAAAALGEPDVAPRALYNKGNSLVKAGRYGDAVKAYAGALRSDPSDMDAKYNLSYALRMMRRQEQQQQQQQQQSPRNQDRKQDEQKDRRNDGQNDRQDQRPDQQQDRQERQAGGREKQMSPKEAERILEALKNNERDVQKKVRVRAAQRATTERDW